MSDASDVQIPSDVFWVYTTGRFHSIATRADMGDEFRERWHWRSSHFPVAWRADFIPDELHHAREGPTRRIFDAIWLAKLREAGVIPTPCSDGLPLIDVPAVSPKMFMTYGDSIHHSVIMIDGHVKRIGVFTCRDAAGRIVEAERVIEWEMSDAYWVAHALPLQGTEAGA